MVGKIYYYLKLEQDYFNNKAIKTMRKLPSGAEMMVVYLKMQLRYINSGGTITFDGMLPTIEEEIALEIDEEPNVVRLTLNALTKWGLVEVVNDNELYMLEYQKRVGSKGESALRMERHRERKKMLCNDNVTQASLCDVDVTKCDVIKEIEIEKEIDIELDLEKEIEKEKESTAPQLNSFEQLIEKYTSNSHLKESLKRYVEFRRKDSSFLPNTFELALNDLKGYSNDEEEQIQIVNQSVEKRWFKLYPLKKTNKPKYSYYEPMPEYVEDKQENYDVNEVRELLKGL